MATPAACFLMSPNAGVHFSQPPNGCVLGQWSNRGADGSFPERCQSRCVWWERHAVLWPEWGPLQLLRQVARLLALCHTGEVIGSTLGLCGA